MARRATHGAEGEWIISSYVIIEAPSILGLFPGGVERLPEALLAAGFADRLGARRGGRVRPLPYDSRLDTVTGVLNPTGLRDYAHLLAAATGEVLDHGEIPIVLGGDCSILLGNLLALRRRGRHGLLFIDGHADFYQPAAEPRGEAASMDLALATGRGPSVLTDLEGRGPLVRDEDVAVFGRRDATEAELPAANASRTPRSPSSTWRRSGSEELSAPPGTHSRTFIDPSSPACGSTSTATPSTTPSCQLSTTDCPMG